MFDRPGFLMEVARFPRHQRHQDFNPRRVENGTAMTGIRNVPPAHTPQEPRRRRLYVNEEMPRGRTPEIGAAVEAALHELPLPLEPILSLPSIGMQMVICALLVIAIGYAILHNVHVCIAPPSIQVVQACGASLPVPYPFGTPLLNHACLASYIHMCTCVAPFISYNLMYITSFVSPIQWAIDLIATLLSFAHDCISLDYLCHLLTNYPNTGCDFECGIIIAS